MAKSYYERPWQCKLGLHRWEYSLVMLGTRVVGRRRACTRCGCQQKTRLGSFNQWVGA